MAASCLPPGRCPFHQDKQRTRSQRQQFYKWTLNWFNPRYSVGFSVLLKMRIIIALSLRYHWNLGNTKPAEPCLIHHTVCTNIHKFLSVLILWGERRERETNISQLCPSKFLKRNTCAVVRSSSLSLLAHCSTSLHGISANGRYVEQCETDSRNVYHARDKHCIAASDSFCNFP